ncbi:winged helix-turn-helix domain-containing protein [Sphingomonas sp. M1-B02]|uniref:winged helix-turn-helix domain-containing protein n=1 Tax=Sphingomonas sp. M1-B02 TaxID=3114300 RepID=UPI00223F4FFB|nr:transcriptional regulator [Sphingomonas sp. S6-11]UZK66323.1 transcriptional regulator [Sphingomonas sp. S6-11]
MRERAIRRVGLGIDQNLKAEAAPGSSAQDGPLRFGQFLVFPRARSLEREGLAVDLGSRAFDLLMILLQSRGRIVSKDEIMKYVWPSTYVEDANLRVQMACLRRTLGSDSELIKTIPGRGYVAVADNEASRFLTVPSLTRDAGSSSPVDGKPSIVIIDTNPANRAALHRLLQPFHAHVQSFVSVEAFFSSGSATPQTPEWQ